METPQELSEHRAKMAVATLEAFVWKDYIYPMVTAECSKYLQVLASKKSEDDDIKRGWIQALTWVANLPKTDIDEQRQYEEENEKLEQDNQEDPDTTRGRRSPYVAVQEEVTS